jgi:acetyl esterase
VSVSATADKNFRRETAAGVATKYHDGPGLIHGYFGLGEASQTARLEAQRARADFSAMLRA